MDKYGPVSWGFAGLLAILVATLIYALYAFLRYPVRPLR